MSDEEILAELDEWLNNSLFTSSYRKLAIQELIRRYNQLKLTTYRIEGIIEKQQKEIEGLKIIHNKYKDRIKWKPIKKYDRKKYDWVLIRYFDEDFECVPEVAEQRKDGKWYTSEREIPSQFEVKYFFDMQELLKDE